MALDLQDIRERKTAAVNGWRPIRKEAAEDMKFVAGDPWSEDDKRQRDKRPTIAPQEMGQYFNQVINQLWSNPRGMKFSPKGTGATVDGAEFYEGKARETEYRSSAKTHYTTAASNAIQRSYGFVRVYTEFELRSPNQEIWIGGFPDPDVVEPDPEALMPDSSDMKFCFVNEWLTFSEHKKAHPKAKTPETGAWMANLPEWITGNKILRSEYWYETTRPRTLVLVTPPAPQMPAAAPGMLGIAGPASAQAPPPQPYSAFEDELDDQVVHSGAQIRAIRKVDYPSIKMCLTNGLEIFSEHEWPGRYIPIVSCYGKILFVPRGGQTERVILSMTRFGRDPWKAMCYAASQQLEVISQIPKAPLIGAKGQFDGHEREFQQAMHEPKAYLEYNATTEDTGPQPLPPPSRIDYPAGEHLQALELVKEGYRRAIQSAMCANFLPTDAAQNPQQSGLALGKIDKAYASGTFHFVNNYEDMIRRVGIIFEDLADKIYDYAGETGTLKADGSAQAVSINTDDGVSTKGDYQVTVSTGPSSDSEREAALEFGAALLPQLPQIAQFSGPQAAASLLAQVIRLQAGGPLMDEMADIIAPPVPQGADGKPVSPEVQALMQQLQQAHQQLQQAQQMLQGKQIEQQGRLQVAQLQAQSKMQVTQYQTDAQSQSEAADRAVKLDVAAIEAKIETMAMVLEELQRIGGMKTDAATRLHDAGQAALTRQHQAMESQKDRAHDLLMSQVMPPTAPPPGAGVM